MVLHLIGMLMLLGCVLLVWSASRRTRNEVMSWLAVFLLLLDCSWIVALFFLSVL